MDVAMRDKQEIRLSDIPFDTIISLSLSYLCYIGNQNIFE